MANGFSNFQWRLKEMESIDEKAKLINEADLSAHKNIADKNARRLQH